MEQRRATEVMLPIGGTSRSSFLSSVAVASVFPALAWLAVLARLWTRLRLTRAPGIDDLFLVFSLIFYTLFAASTDYIAVNVTGRSVIAEDRLRVTMDFFFVAEVSYVVSMTLVKISLGLFFLRLVIEPIQRRIVRALIVVSTLSGITYGIYGIFQCGNPAGDPPLWLRVVTNRCTPPSYILGMGYTHASINAVTDLMYIGIPIAMLRKSRKSPREKAMIAGLLMLGGVDGVVSIVRIYFIRDLTDRTTDAFRRLAWVGIVSAIEPGLAITASSLATLRPLFRQLSRRFTTKSHSSSAPPNQGPLIDPRSGPARPPPARRIEQRGFSILDDPDTLKSGYSMWSSATSTGGSLLGTKSSGYAKKTVDSNVSRAPTRWWRRGWWKPPTFEAGLMTEFNRAVDEENQLPR